MPLAATLPRLARATRWSASGSCQGFCARRRSSLPRALRCVRGAEARIRSWRSAASVPGACIRCRAGADRALRRAGGRTGRRLRARANVPGIPLPRGGHGGRRLGGRRHPVLARRRRPSRTWCRAGGADLETCSPASPGGGNTPMTAVSDREALARVITALEPYLDVLVFVGGWAHRLYE